MGPTICRSKWASPGPVCGTDLEESGHLHHGGEREEDALVK